MNLVDTDKRLEYHLAGWLRKAQGELKSAERYQAAKRPGYTLVAVAHARGRVQAFEECLNLAMTHREQAELFDAHAT